MAERVLPTGTVTFLFSDMEGSTRLVRDLGPATFAEVLERHNAILRGVFAARGATERGTQGDSFLVMFPEAPAALAAAAEAQRAMAESEWPEGAPVRVRMGVHTGVARLGGDDYVGLDIHRAARIAALGHGGQVLLSDATRALTANDLPAGVTVRSLGSHLLRDLERPEPLHQLVIEGLPSDFPALSAAEAVAGNLPTRLTTFVGRDHELEALERLLDETPLVTITGPGGTGKTRLAIELARRSVHAYQDGAWLVRLEGVEDPALVLATIAATFGLVESRGTSPIQRLHGFLADRSILVVLDNFEHLLLAAPAVNELLEAGPGLRVVVTSRAPLRLGLEQEFPLSPLGQAEAIGLFVERARHADPAFRLTDENRAGVADVCDRLDGLPLGIELAAARIGLLPPDALAGQLTHRLDLPGTGPRDLPARQRTLTETIAWSFDLLDEPARRLLERLSVFAGGFRLAEVEAVGRPADELGAEPLDALSTLVEQSLLEHIPGPDVPRFRMLETIQRFARVRLEGRAATSEARDRHAAAYLALAEEAAAHMPGRDQVPWLDRMQIEHDNFRAAFGWAIERGDAELAHRLLSACWRFWQFRGHVTEGRARADEVLAMPGGDVTTTWRMWALDAAGGLAWWAGDVPRADAFYQRQLGVARTLDDRRGTAEALFNLTHTRFLVAGGDFSVIEPLRAEAIAIYTELGDELALARVEFTRAYAISFQGDNDQARALIAKTLHTFEAAGDEYYIALAGTALGGIALMERDVPTAIRIGLRGLQSNWIMGDVASITLTLRAASALWMMTGRPEQSATMFGAFEGHRRRYGVAPPMDPDLYMGLAGSTEELLAVLDRPEFQAARARGEAMSTDAVVAYIFDEAAELSAATAPS
jgi:predicted ATPase/class 3 adenylate cyclase